MNPFTLKDKTVLVTGASSGIGKATASLCADLGAKVVALGRNELRLEETIASLSGEGHIRVVLDLDDEKAVDSAVLGVPLLDGVANCAGIANMNPFQFVTKEELARVMDVNCIGPVMLVNQLLKAKKLKKGGSVVFVSSVDGPKIVHAGNSVYSASKSALVGMARNMVIDLAGKKIRVNSVLPGTTDTPMVRTGSATEEMLAETNRLCEPLNYDDDDIAEFPFTYDDGLSIDTLMDAFAEYTGGKVEEIQEELFMDNPGQLCYYQIEQWQ